MAPPLFPIGTVAGMHDPAVRLTLAGIGLVFWIYLWYKFGKDWGLFDSSIKMEKRLARLIGAAIPMLAFLYLIFIVSGLL